MTKKTFTILSLSIVPAVASLIIILLANISAARTTSTTATGTAVTLSKMFEINPLSPGGRKGVCIKILDLDGANFTYLSTTNGVGTFSTISCE